MRSRELNHSSPKTTTPPSSAISPIIPAEVFKCRIIVVSYITLFSKASHPRNSSYTIITVLINIRGILINVRTLVIKFINLLFTLASPPFPVPNAGSDTLFDHPTRARKRSSERIAMAFTRRTEMYIRFPNAKNIILAVCLRYFLWWVRSRLRSSMLAGIWRGVPRCPVEVGRLSARTRIDEAISWREAAWWALGVLCVYL